MVCAYKKWEIMRVIFLLVWLLMYSNFACGMEQKVYPLYSYNNEKQVTNCLTRIWDCLTTCFRAWCSEPSEEDEREEDERYDKEVRIQEGPECSWNSFMIDKIVEES